MFEYDLHLHSTASDGLLKPSAVVDLAAAQGLKGIALTDHDNTQGLAEAAARARELGLDFIYGVELSTRLPMPNGKLQKMHILGYFTALPGEPLQGELAHQLEMRRSRAMEIGRRLAAIGCPIDVDALLAQHEGGHIGRPHFAMALVEAGYVTGKQEAFDRFLNDGGPAYVPYQDPLDSLDAVRLITAAGGKAVLAHPGEYGLGAVDPRLDDLLAAGLAGIECSHPRNAHDTEHHYRQLCYQYGLAATGGSDFHGPVQKGLVLPGRYGCFTSDLPLHTN